MTWLGRNLNPNCSEYTVHIKIAADEFQIVVDSALAINKEYYRDHENISYLIEHFTQYKDMTKAFKKKKVNDILEAIWGSIGSFIENPDAAVYNCIRDIIIMRREGKDISNIDPKKLYEKKYADIYGEEGKFN